MEKVMGTSKGCWHTQGPGTPWVIESYFTLKLFYWNPLRAGTAGGGGVCSWSCCSDRGKEAAAPGLWITSIFSSPALFSTRALHGQLNWKSEKKGPLCSGLSLKSALTLPPFPSLPLQQILLCLLKFRPAIDLRGHLGHPISMLFRPICN